MPETPLSAVTFDLDGTLLDYDDDAWEQTVRSTCDGLRRTVPGLDTDQLFTTYTRICLAHWRAASTGLVRAPSGALDGLSIWRELWQRALIRCGQFADELAEQALQLYREDRLRRYRLFDDVPAALDALRDRVGPLALVTNGPADTQREKLAVTGLADCFDVVVISGEVGVAKPDKRVFEVVSQGLGVAPSTIWHVGDSLASDVAGANNAGLGAGVWLNRRGTTGPTDGPAPGFEIGSLAQLAGLVPA